MNKKSPFDSDIPSDSAIIRGISRLHRLGIQAIPGRAIYRLLSLLFHYRATRCVRVNLENWHLTPFNAAPFEIRSLSPDELKAQAKQIGVDLEGIEHAQGAGVAPFGAVKGASIVSCLWISPHPPGLRDDFALEFEDRLFFSTNPSPYPNSEGMA